MAVAVKNGDSPGFGVHEPRAARELGARVLLIRHERRPAATSVDEDDGGTNRMPHLAQPFVVRIEVELVPVGVRTRVRPPLGVPRAFHARKRARRDVFDHVHDGVHLILSPRRHVVHVRKESSLRRVVIVLDPKRRRAASRERVAEKPQRARVERVVVDARDVLRRSLARALLRVPQHLLGKPSRVPQKLQQIARVFVRPSLTQTQRQLPSDRARARVPADVFDAVLRRLAHRSLESLTKRRLERRRVARRASARLRRERVPHVRRRRRARVSQPRRVQPRGFVVVASPSRRRRVVRLHRASSSRGPLTSRSPARRTTARAFARTARTRRRPRASTDRAS